MKVTNLEELLVHKLHLLYDAEHQVIEALPKIIEATTSEELKLGFETHLEETKNQVKRLEKAFESLGQTPEMMPCHAMKGILQEGEEMIEKNDPSAVLDAGILAGAQAVEHHEIACYGTAITWAEQLGHQEAADILKETLSEEESTDKKLTDLAESSINAQAQ
jgi:ferritin-like metal-binding protein YciE